MKNEMELTHLSFWSELCSVLGRMTVTIRTIRVRVKGMSEQLLVRLAK